MVLNNKINTNPQLSMGSPIESSVGASGTTLTGDGILMEESILVPKFGEGSTLLLLLLLLLRLLSVFLFLPFYS